MRNDEPSSPRAALTWRRALLRGAEQALDDIARAETSSVCALRESGGQLGSDFATELRRRAYKRGVATAEVHLFSDRALDAFEALVRATAGALRAREDASRPGLVGLLDAFAGAHGERALVAFDGAARRLGAAGDITALARSYLEARRSPRRAELRLDAWFAGTSVSRAEANGVALGTLTRATAKAALYELTRLACVLGARGMLLVLTGGEQLARLPAARRRDSYTVLRELVDDADGGRGLYATLVLLAGAAPLFEGASSLHALAPLAGRLLALPDAPPDALPPPHRPLIALEAPPAFRPGLLPEVRPAREGAARELRSILRASHGLPPTDALSSMTVGYAAVDATIDALFSHSAMQGSVFALLRGGYGTGKTHLLLHLAARALADRRPVFRLALERLAPDLGAPQHHFRRLLAGATLPLTGAPSLLDLLARWTRDPGDLARVFKSLRAVAAEEGEAAGGAQRVLELSARAKNPAAALESYLGGAELLEKPATAPYRASAYARLLVWLALLERVERCAGPVLLVDEAENLYRSGTSRAERRTALRSLAFYCSGALPRACVVLAITPDALLELRGEADDLLRDVAEQRTVLAWEDAAMLARRLRTAPPVDVPALAPEHLRELAERVRATHARVRGDVTDDDYAAYAAARAVDAREPRAFVRLLVDRLERLWWNAPPPDDSHR